MIIAFILSLAVLLAASSAAHAEPVTIALFGSATFLGQVVSLIITAAVYVGASLLQRSKTSETTSSGVQFDVEIGDDNPIGFTVGTYATSGTRKYRGTWGSVSGTPNAYLTDVVQIGDRPAPGQPGLWLNDEKCTILWGATPVAQGYPIEECRVDGVDYAWALYRDGTETTASTFLLNKFGSLDDKPWQNDMIGRGCPHIIVTARYNQDLFSGQMECLVEPPAPAWYDLREDDTAGGSGDQRWDDPATGQPTDNPAVIIYNIVRGIYYGDEWLFGGQNLPAFRLPAASWMAAANECDALVDLADGGSEKQYRCGYEVRGDREPLDVIEELLKACNGRLAEVGGIFKLLVGAPGSAVYAFTDGDVVVTEGQTLTPFPSLDDTYNGVEATYPEPEEKWENKDAPARYSDTLEDEDSGRRLPQEVSLPAVPFAIQVQRLMKTMGDEERRFLVHSFFLPPEAALLEPNDVLAYTSTRNGYTNKKWLVTRIVGKRTMLQQVQLKEIEPGVDYAWNAATEQKAVSTGYIGPVRTPPQPMTGWAVEPYVQEPSKPNIKVRFAAHLDDVRAVRVQARPATETLPFFDGESPYDATLDEPSVVPVATFVRNTAYQARGILVPYTARLTTWSSWLAVTTPDVGLTESELDAILTAKVAQIESALNAALTNRQDVDSLSASVASFVTTIKEALGQINIAVGSRYEENKAGAELALTSATNANSALAAILGDVFATAGVISAGVKLRFAASAAPDGALASVAIEARASVDDEWIPTGFYMDVWDSDIGGVGRIRLVADQIIFANSSGLISFDAFDLTITDNEPLPVPIVGGEIQADLSTLRRNFETTIDQNFTYRFPVGGKPGHRWTHFLKNNSAGGHTATFGATGELFGAAPSYTAAGDVLNILDGRIIRTAPLKMLLDIPVAALEVQPPDLAFVTHIYPAGAFSPINDLGCAIGDFCIVISANGASTYNESGTRPSVSLSLQGAPWNTGPNLQADCSVSANFKNYYYYYRTRLAISWKRIDGSETADIFANARDAFRISGGGVAVEAGRNEVVGNCSSPGATGAALDGVPTSLITIFAATCYTTSANQPAWATFTPTYDNQYFSAFGFDNRYRVRSAYKIQSGTAGDVNFSASGFSRANLLASLTIKAPPF